MSSEIEDLEIERLNQAIKHERNLKEMLDSSIGEVKSTIAELESQINNVDDEKNEWKTRYEIQLEINEQYTKQSLLLQDKLQTAKNQLKEVQKSIKNNSLNADFGEISAHTIRKYEKEKEKLVNQRKDLDWRINQESKAYDAACEERRNCQLELAAAQMNIIELKSKIRKEVDSQQLANPAQAEFSPRIHHTSRRRTGASRNIANDHRILDRTKGPIKKSAAVKELPSIKVEEES